MLSEEEIIKYLENVVSTIKESDMLFDEPANIRCGLKMSGALQGLLDLYKKEKEKNKNSISKDKIIAKIEPKLKELDKQINEEWKKYGNSKELQDMEDMYNFLQELLEESE